MNKKIRSVKKEFEDTPAATIKEDLKAIYAYIYKYVENLIEHQKADPCKMTKVTFG